MTIFKLLFLIILPTLHVEEVYTAPIFLTLISLMNLPAYAGFERAKTMMEKVQSGLSMLALCTVGVAVIFVGYKIIFGGCIA